MVPPERLTATYSTSSNLASNQMAFLVNNTGSVDVVIKEVQLHVNATNFVLSATQLSGNSINAGTSTLMIATFLGVDFNGNFNIYFILTSTRGTHFPATCGPCTYTRVEQLNIVSATITITGSSVAFGLQNSGTSDLVLVSASVTGGSYSNAAGTFPTATSSSTVCGVTGGQATIPKGSRCTLTATFTSGGSFVAGTTYSFKLVSIQGNAFPYTTTA